MTTNYILNLRDYLEKNFEKEWPSDLTGVYLAGALHLLRKEDDAGKLIARVIDRTARPETMDTISTNPSAPTRSISRSLRANFPRA